MGDLFVVFPDQSEQPIVEPGKVTKEEGVIFPVSPRENLRVIVREYNREGDAKIRAELSRDGNPQVGLYYGWLREKSNTDFGCIYGNVSIFNKERT